MSVYDVFAVTILTMVVAMVLAPLATGLLLYLYRRYVRRRMGRRSNAAPATPPSQAAPLAPPTAAEPEWVYVGGGAGSEPTPPSDLYERMRGLAGSATRIYAAAGLAYGAGMAAGRNAGDLISRFSVMPTEEMLNWLWLFVYMVCLFAYPVLMVANFITASDRRNRLLITGLYSGIFLFTIMSATGSAFWLFLRNWALFSGVPSVFLCVFLYGGIAGIGPIVYPLLLYAGFGPMLVFWAWLNMNRLDLWYTVAVVALPLAVGVGSILTLLLKWLYRHKWVSEKSLIIDSVWLSFGFSYTVVLASALRSGLYWALVALGSFVLFKIVAAVGFSMSEVEERAWGRLNPRHLLFLRLSTQGKRSEKLYAAVASSWRYVGSICRIIGPDLARWSVEPYSLMDYVWGRIGQSFVYSADSLERRIAGMDLAPDPDWRYRVNDLYCYEDTWHLAVARLASQNAAALLDLRAFSGQNPGDAVAVEALLNSLALERILFVVDEATDELLLRQTIQQAWARLNSGSPNCRSQSPRMHLFRYTGKGLGDNGYLLRALAAAAE